MPWYPWGTRWELEAVAVAGSLPLTSVPIGLGELGGGGGATNSGQPKPGAGEAGGLPAQEEKVAPEGLAQGNGVLGAACPAPCRFRPLQWEL